MHKPENLFYLGQTTGTLFREDNKYRCFVRSRASECVGGTPARRLCHCDTAPGATSME